MNSLRKTTGPVSLIQTIMILYLAVWSISPPLSMGMLYRLAALGAVFVWFMLEILNGMSFSVPDIEAIVFVGAIVLTSFIETGGFSSILKNISLFMASLCFIIQDKYNDRWSELENIVPVILGLLVFFNIRTFTTLLTDSTIARKIVRNDDEMIPYLKSGVGGYALVYLQVCIFPAVLAWIMKSIKINRLFFVLGIAWLVTYILVILNAGYSLALFTSGASAIILLFYKGRSVAPAVIAMLCIFVAAMFALIYLEGLRNWLLVQFDGTAVAKKINDLVATSESGEAEGSIYSRVHAYSKTLKVITQYPIIGYFWAKADIGSHSAILDTIAKYGVLGGLMYLRYLFNGATKLKNKFSDNLLVCKITNACFCSLVFVGVLDTITYEFMTPIIILIPLLINTVRLWDERLNNDEDTVDS